MSSTPLLLRATALACLMGAAAPSLAQESAAPAKEAAAATAPPAAASAPAAGERRATAATRPAHITVIEDDSVRIEEHRVRGVVTKVVVQSKVSGAPPYEIQVAPPGRESMSDRGATGKRTWSLLRF